ncbi:MAG: hypothetical protein US52_C0003G0003 [candidate division WS6 bacterium GW2011_GWA2_37_6]|uniref:Zinc metallopeptidase n=1 Tax=candidate division WS6 bacterium GW2011_GWA2_37_6 TaxID=1619087 RepID=A0A0G0H283_9BACT|nr:MAG: hypothetical protein US52_C0003G0003 [candidate division WS6 bacterium GW2011_GWA2_37_6]
MFYFDPQYLFFMLPALLVSLLASILLRIWTNEYLSRPNSTNLNGYDVMQKITTSSNLRIGFSISPGDLTDHYDPSKKLLVLSNSVAQRPTIGSVAIAAHELGHAKQHQDKSILLGLRGVIVPVVNIGTNLGYVLIIIGLVLSFSELAWLGVVFFSFSTLFSFLTLPIEIDASAKAIKMIRKNSLLSNSEIGGAKKVLIAASLTYIAGTISSLANLAYFVFRVRGINNRD